MRASDKSQRSQRFIVTLERSVRREEAGLPVALALKVIDLVEDFLDLLLGQGQLSASYGKWVVVVDGHPPVTDSGEPGFWLCHHWYHSLPAVVAPTTQPLAQLSLTFGRAALHTSVA